MVTFTLKNSLVVLSIPNDQDIEYMHVLQVTMTDLLVLCALLSGGKEDHSTDFYRNPFMNGFYFQQKNILYF